ncbi:MAG: histidine phosphatase family protein [Blastocatellia bacterium]|nr:histidine phosphatase family protein [Blastocatellia bacterium]
MKLTSIAARCSLLVLLLLTGLPLCSNISAKVDFSATTVYLVRHAEKEKTPPNDPPLSEAGLARSKNLARILQKAGIKAIYTSQFLRTQQTAQPLAEASGIAVVQVPLRMDPSNPRKVSEASLREAVEKVYEHGGGGVLIVGHSNTVPEMIRLLGGDQVPFINESVYDDLFVVTVYEKGKAKVAHLKY